MKKINLIGISCLTLLLACKDNKKTGDISDTPQETRPAVENINYAVVKTWPHDTNSFTEGLLFHEGKLYESTGSPDYLPDTRSEFGIVDTLTGSIGVKGALNRDKYFGEGIVFLNNKLYQLTYQTNTGFIYDATTFKQIGQFSFANKEGWGLTTDSTYIIMSDGTSTLTFIDPATMKPAKTITVTDENGAVSLVNELEYIKGKLYANLYTKDDIIRIDPATGKVTGRINLSTLTNEAKAKDADALELNGIAYDPVQDRIFITGKMWPAIYQVSFTH